VLLNQLSDFDLGLADATELSERHGDILAGKIILWRQSQRMRGGDSCTNPAAMFIIQLCKEPAPPRLRKIS
jgi:hypothetical protein